ncbi:uncharacterized protein K444DRAFT_221860 [Hyaloscypha bicolor E]|uniref:Uncharacterized protein n=1 Tax=Hyaloscypha bicolor E TaxID=1095630 RepID=A0A2J6SJK5_9HELO|nr:uncharacterized protein K444DRAFT_221860 [Hyaloscypha bicolor E]PMD50945.1 hypothetical protein K444DRAFT_221860 [Hyaloscypha bicolor E]
MAQIKAGPGQRSVRLEGMCQDYLSKFEDSLVQLTAVSVQLDRRIELNTRNKDATSDILTMRDSRTGISQNGTVQRLTYLTIGYLPIALMAAIFAIPKEQNVLYFPSMADHGRSWFIGAIFIISFFTYTLAVYIGAILNYIGAVLNIVLNPLQAFFRYPPPPPAGGESKRKKAGPNKNPPNFWRDSGIQFVFRWMRDNWLVGNFKKKDGEAQEIAKAPTDPFVAAEQGEGTARFGSGSSGDSDDAMAKQPEVKETSV